MRAALLWLFFGDAPVLELDQGPTAIHVLSTTVRQSSVSGEIVHLARASGEQVEL